MCVRLCVCVCVCVCVTTGGVGMGVYGRVDTNTPQIHSVETIEASFSHGKVITQICYTV